MLNLKLRPLLTIALLALFTPLRASEPQSLNDGQLLVEGAPPLPQDPVPELSRYQRTRSTWFVDFAAGGGIYVKTRADGIQQVHHVPKPLEAARQLTRVDHPVGEVAVRPGGRQFAFTMSRNGSGFEQIYLFDLATGETRRITAGEALNNRLAWDADGSRLAWRSTRRNGRHNDVWLMNIEDPQSARAVLEVNDGALWKPVSFSRDGGRLLVQYYAGVSDSRVYLLDLHNGALDLLAGSEDVASSNVATGFSADDDGALFVTNQRHRSAEIGRVSLADGKEVRFMPDNIEWDVTEFELSDDRRRGAFVTNEGGISQLYLFDPERGEYRRVRRTPLGIISGLRFSPDGRRLGLSINTPHSPSDAHVLHLGRKPLSRGRLTRWTESDRAGRRFTEPVLTRFPSPARFNDQFLMIPTFLYTPPRGRPPYPVVIYVHGGPEGQFRPGFNATVQFWLDTLGVAVVAPNVRGSLGYGADYLALDDGLLREHAVHDIGALLDWIGERKDLDQERVAIFGASYGGYMALATAVHYGDRIRAAVNRAGISHFVSYLENTQGYRRDLRRAEYGDERVPEIRDFLERISPLNKVERITTPLLIAQGRNDPVVPESESRQMVAALRERGRTVWYVNALNEGHGFERKENRDAFERITHLFLQRYLLDPPPD